MIVAKFIQLIPSVSDAIWIDGSQAKDDSYSSLETSD
jgi:hypothetical protein